LSNEKKESCEFSISHFVMEKKKPEEASWTMKQREERSRSS